MINREKIDEIEKIEKLTVSGSFVKTNFLKVNLYAKLEFSQFTGSIKDRPALFLIRRALENNLINEDTVVIESSSGNFALGLAFVCKKINIKFIPVIDPNILIEKEKTLRLISHDVYKVTERDETGGYLANRLKTVNKLLSENNNFYNPNQYTNENNYLCYYHTLGLEIIRRFEKLDYLFVSVSSGGTIAGLSIRLKEKFKNLKVIAVDVEGSLIFQNKLKDRHIPGMGSHMRTKAIEEALIDDIVILSELEIINACEELFLTQGLFTGGSSGAAYYAAKKYLNDLKSIKGSENALFICPDKGNSYLDTVYNKEWIEKYITKNR